MIAQMDPYASATFEHRSIACGALRGPHRHASCRQALDEAGQIWGAAGTLLVFAAYLVGNQISLGLADAIQQMHWIQGGEDLLKPLLVFTGDPVTAEKPLVRCWVVLQTRLSESGRVYR